MPAPAGQVYFNSVPVLNDDVTVLGLDGSSVVTKGKKIAIGGTAIIEVQLASEAATSGPWTVAAFDANELLGQAPNLTLSWDKTSGTNGDTLHLTATVNAADPNVEGEIFMIDSSLEGQSSISVGIVGQQ